jgi:acetyl esterase
MTALTLRQRLEFRAARGISLIPPRWQVRLSGRPPVTIDGQTLEPEIQLLLAAIERRGRPPYEQMSLDEGRAEMRRGAIVAGGHPPALAAVNELTVAGAAGPLAARQYLPFRASEPQPLIVFFHGGGFVQGGLDSHDVPCRLLAKHSGARVLSVDYRLAPEHPFPAAVEDACAALRWAFEHAPQLGADADRIAVAGDSAGGNLAAVAAAAEPQAADGRRPRLQILIYPATDFASRARSHDLFEQGFLLIREDMDWFSANYVGDADKHDPRLSVLRAPDPEGSVPALITTAGFDPLRDEGEAYAARLRAAGVPVVLRRFPGLIHGFFNLTGISRSSRDAVIEIAGAARAMLNGATAVSPGPAVAFRQGEAAAAPT